MPAKGYVPQGYSSFKEYRKEKRQEAIDYLSGKCSMCGTTDNLQFDHLNLKDSEGDRNLRRKTNGKKRVWSRNINSLSELKKHHSDVRLLCKECHNKWSCAQRSAAIKLLASLPIEEQIKLTNAELI